MSSKQSVAANAPVKSRMSALMTHLSCSHCYFLLLLGERQEEESDSPDKVEVVDASTFRQ